MTKNVNDVLKDGDVSTITLMIANLLSMPDSVIDDGESWKRRGLALAYGVIKVLCHHRDTTDYKLTVDSIIEHLEFGKLEELYLEGHQKAQQSADRKTWPDAYDGIKMYLEIDLVGFSTYRLVKKNNLTPADCKMHPQVDPIKAIQSGLIHDPKASELHAYDRGTIALALIILQKCSEINSPAPRFVTAHGAWRSKPTRFFIQFDSNDLSTEMGNLLKASPDENGVRRIVTPFEYTGSGDHIVIRVRSNQEGGGYFVDDNGDTALKVNENGGEIDKEDVRRWTENLASHSSLTFTKDETISAHITQSSQIAPHVFSVAAAALQLFALATTRVS